MLSGENGILQRAKDAKIRTEKATIIESAQTDILSQIAENKGEDITDSQFKAILGKYFKEESIPNEIPEDLSNLELTTSDGKYKIIASEIYDGKIKTLTPGLYYAGTDNLYMSWEDLINPDNHMLILTDTTLSRNAFNIEDRVKLVIASNVTNISGLQGLSQLEEVIIPAGVTSIENSAFSSSGLKSIEIPNSVTNIGTGIFSGCTNLESVKIEASGNLDSRLFAGCSSLKYVYLGENLILPSNGISFGPGQGCNKIETAIILSSGGIAAGSFAGNQSLTSVKLGEKVTSIDAYAFKGCSNLSKIEIERTEHSSLISIGQNAFSGTSIKQILLPDSLQTIRYRCFSRMRKSFVG